jgi:membrane-bound lytic murein transglycosylase D
VPSLPSIAFHIQAFAVGTALLLAGCAQLSDQTTTGVDKQPAVRQVENQRPPTDMDLWQRLREGFAIAPTTLHPSVEAQRDWYLENPSYLETVFARAQPYIF